MKWPRTRDAGDTGVGHARPYALAMRSALPRLLPWIAVAWCLVGCAFLVGELHRDEANLILDRMDDLRAGRLDLPNAREQIATGIGRLAGARAARARPSRPGGT